MRGDGCNGSDGYTAETPRAAVQAIYYPPRGSGGVVGLARAQGYGASFQQYRSWLDDNTVVSVVVIEHVDSVNAMDSDPFGGRNRCLHYRTLRFVRLHGASRRTGLSRGSSLR